MTSACLNARVNLRAFIIVYTGATTQSMKLLHTILHRNIKVRGTTNRKLFIVNTRKRTVVLNRKYMKYKTERSLIRRRPTYRTLNTVSVFICHSLAK